MSAVKESSELSIEELYVKEKKKSQVLMAAIAVLAIALIGSLLFAGNDSTTTTTAPTPTFEQRPARGAGRGSVTSFFNSDGSINQVAVDGLVAQAESRGLDPSQLAARFEGQIEAGLSSGEITKTQATKLEEALGL